MPINKVFEQGPAIISYITAGDGGMEYSLQAVLALVQAGVNIIELGVPFSDPIADGPVIQRAMQRALEAGTNLDDVLYLVRNIRKQTSVPIILFSYYNPILNAMNHNRLIQIKTSGVNALLVVDLPLEEARILQQQCDQHDIKLIYLVTPTTPLDRIKAIAEHAKGFIYYACRKGITGVRSSLPTDLTKHINQIKEVTNTPVVVGFGIADKSAVDSVLSIADGVVIGSHLVQAIEDGACPQDLGRIVYTLLGSNTYIKLLRR